MQNYQYDKEYIVKHLLIFWMCTWMDYTIHIQIQVIKLDIIWIRLGDIYRYRDPIYFLGLQLYGNKSINSNAHTTGTGLAVTMFTNFINTILSRIVASGSETNFSGGAIIKSIKMLN